MSTVHTPPATGGRVIRISTAATVVGVAAVAAFVSYRHAYDVATAHGETGTTAGLLPLTIDGLVFVASMVMLDSARRGQPSPGLAKWALALGIGSTVAVNVLHGAAHGPIGAIIAAWPAVTLVLVVELLMGMIRRGRAVVEVAEADDVELPAELVLSHPGQPLAEVPDPGQLPVRTLTEAVRSARAAGLSVRAVAEEYGITRYRVGQLTGASTAASNGQGSAT